MQDRRERGMVVLLKYLGEFKAACTVTTAVIGVSFISGRETVSFFSCAGSMSWVGAAVSAAVFGLLMGMICHFVRETGAHDLPGIYYRKMDQRCGDAMGVVHALMMLMMGAVALSTAGEAGMLALDMRNPYLISASAAIIIAAVMSMSGMRLLPSMTMLIAPIIVVFFCALAIDPRPIRAGAYIAENSMDLAGNLPVSVLLGVLFAFLKSAMACGVAAVHSYGLRPRIFAAMCASVSFVIIAAANWAMLRAGAEVRALSIPTVVMAARWGMFGYYLSIVIMFLGASAVLAVAMGSLKALFSESVKKPVRILITTIGIILMSFTGLRPMITVGYPMLGWISAMCLMALVVFYDRGRSAGRYLPERVR